MDLIIHRLILTISKPDGSSTWTDTFESVSALHRRIASQHPFAFVRYDLIVESSTHLIYDVTTIPFAITITLFQI